MITVLADTGTVIYMMNGEFVYVLGAIGLKENHSRE
jgi:hypothetical protein